MSSRTAGVFMVLVLLVGIVLAACSPSFSEKTKQAEEDVRKTIMTEGDLLYDNGKNFLAVNTGDWAEAIIVLQSWLDAHPAKRIVSISSDSAGTDGLQTVWLVYYENQ